MKEQVRLLYAELQGYLAQVPESTATDVWSRDKRMWEQFNFIVSELEKITSVDYSRFKINPDRRAEGISTNPHYYEAIRFSTYRAALGGLIARLHIEFFKDEEEPPFKTMPNTIINTTQNQYQSQEQQQSMVVDIAMIIAEKKAEYLEGTPERNFLDQLGNAIKKTKDVTDIVKTIMSVATACGITLPVLAKIFGS